MSDYRDIKCKEGEFFCLVCLNNKPLAERSFDPRYCKGCCEALLQEPIGKWTPVHPKEKKVELTAAKEQKIKVPFDSTGKKCVTKTFVVNGVTRTQKFWVKEK